MKKTLVAALAAGMMLLAPAAQDVFAQNAQAQGTPVEALSAYNRGEYAKARALVAPLAKAGNPEAQLNWINKLMRGGIVQKDLCNAFILH